MKTKVVYLNGGILKKDDGEIESEDLENAFLDAVEARGLVYAGSMGPIEGIDADVSCIEWISCKDKLPPDGVEDYLVCVPKDTMKHGERICIAHFFGGMWQHSSFTLRGDKEFEPTHWAKFPDMPAGTK